jgi:hypothetical protein
MSERVRWERVDRSLRAKLGGVEMQVTHDALGWHAFASRAARDGALEIVSVNMLASERAAKRRARQEARRLGG